MPFSLSIKQKFILVVFVAIIGFVIQGVIAFSALNQLNKTSAKVAKTQEVSRIISDSQLGASSVTLRRAALVHNEIEIFDQTMEKLFNNQQNALASIKNSTDSKQLKQNVSRLATVLTKYQKEMSTWLDIKQVLGVDKNSGLLAELRKNSEVAIEQVSGFAQMEQQMRRVIYVEKEQLSSSTSGEEDDFSTALEVLK